MQNCTLWNCNSTTYISIDYNNVQAAIQAGQPITALFKTGMEGNNTIAHAVMITGITDDGKINYFDPKDDEYRTTDNFAPFIAGRAIFLDCDTQVICDE